MREWQKIIFPEGNASLSYCTVLNTNSKDYVCIAVRKNDLQKKYHYSYPIIIMGGDAKNYRFFTDRFPAQPRSKLEQRFRKVEGRIENTFQLNFKIHPYFSIGDSVTVKYYTMLQKSVGESTNKPEIPLQSGESKLNSKIGKTTFSANLHPTISQAATISTASKVFRAARNFFFATSREKKNWEQQLNLLEEIESINSPEFLPHLLIITSYDVSNDHHYTLDHAVIAKADACIINLLPQLNIKELIKLRDAYIIRLEKVKSYWKKNAPLLGSKRSSEIHIQRVENVVSEVKKEIQQQLQDSRKTRKIDLVKPTADYVSTHYFYTAIGFGRFLESFPQGFFSLAQDSNPVNLLPRLVTGVIFSLGKGIFYDSIQTAKGLLSTGVHGYNGADCGEGLGNFIASVVPLKKLTKSPRLRPYLNPILGPSKVKPTLTPLQVFLEEVKKYSPEELSPEIFEQIRTTQNRHPSEIKPKDLANIRRKIADFQMVKDLQKNIDTLRIELEMLAPHSKRIRSLQVSFLEKARDRGANVTEALLGNLKGILNEARKIVRETDITPSPEPVGKKSGSRAQRRKGYSPPRQTQKSIEPLSTDTVVKTGPNNANIQSPLDHAIDQPPKIFDAPILEDLTGQKVTSRNGALKELRDFYQSHPALRGALWREIRKLTQGGKIVQDAKKLKKEGRYSLRVSIRYRLFFSPLEGGRYELKGIGHRGNIFGWSEK